jgi:hypothetical protein
MFLKDRHRDVFTDNYSGKKPLTTISFAVFIA